MKTLLQIKSSLFADDGQSSRLADRFVEEQLRRHPEYQLIVRDFVSAPVPHLTAERFAAFTTAAEQRSAEQQAVVAYSDLLIDELRRADSVVLGLPMYNFGIPSMLKAYFDHIARAGVTFRYTANGPQGLLQDRPVYLLAARGGRYLGTAQDTQSGQVRDFFRLLGIENLRFVYAEGLNMGDDARDEALRAAEAEIRRYAA